MRTAAVLVALCASFALGACGSETADDSATDDTSESASASPSDASESPTDTATEPGALAECSDVWVDGATLPEDYTACISEGETIKPEKRKCGYGATFLEQDGQFYAMKGAPITDAGDLETSEEYQQLLATCQA